MRPGVPWSVKGIDDETRQAAKLAARKAGMTLGEWLNTMIKETADEDAPGDQDEASASLARQSQQSQEFKSVTDANQSKQSSRPAVSDQDISRRLDSLAGQLSMLAEPRPQAAVPRFIEPQRNSHEDNLAIQTLIDRIEANERTSADAMSRVNARLENMTDKLAGAAPIAPAMPHKPEDVPGFSALESAMRNIVDHIEASEIATRETLKTIQQRMSDMASRAAQAASEQLNNDAPAISTLEQRVNELTARLDKSRNETNQEIQHYVKGQVSQLAERIDAVRHSADAVVGQAQAAAVKAAQGESRQLEERLKAIIGDLQGQQKPDPDVQRLYAEIESLNQRLDGVSSNSTSESEIGALRTTVEQLSSHMAQGPDPAPVQQLESRLAELGQRLDQLDTAALSPQLADLEQRVQAMDAQLREAVAHPGDPGSANRFSDQMSGVSERLSATESKLNHLSTIEQAIEQLYRSVEEGRNFAGQAAEDAAQRMAQQLIGSGQPMAGASAAPSVELQALESGLTAVKASAEAADQRTQDTLEAVHDTLEQIINKLAQLEQQAPASVAPAPEMMAAPEYVAEVAPAPPVPDVAQTYMADPFSSEAVPLDPPPQTMAQPVIDPALEAYQAAPVAEQPVMPEPELSAPEFITEPVMTPPPVEPAPLASPEPALPSGEVREDFIAAARRAAQNAASQRSSIFGGLSALTSNPSSPDPQEESSGKSGSFFSLPFLKKTNKDHTEDALEPLSADDDDGKTKDRRLHLILAGLVLLAAVSAYAMGDAGKKFLSAMPGTDSTGAVARPQNGLGDQPNQNMAQPVSAIPAKHDNALAQTSGLADVATTSSAMSASTNSPAGASEPAEAAALPSEIVITASLPPATPALAATPVLAAAPALADQQADTIEPDLDSQTTSHVSMTPAAKSSPGDALPAALGPKALRDAAAGGDANAQFVIASRYLDGKAVPRDFNKASGWYRKAAEKGLAPAQYRLGTLYERGHGLTKDMASARAWYERAAENKNVKAMHNLAVIYANNSSNQAQFDKAAKWFRAAADHGLKDSLFNLAVLFERGLGVSQDTKKAYFWYGIAARHGDSDGKAKIATLKSFLTAKQKSDTDAKIATWAPQKPDAAGNFVAIANPAWQVPVAAPAAPVQTDAELSGLSEKQLVLKAQQLLSGMGYDVGPQDGVMGSRTANAVRLFQLQTGAPVNGTVSPQLVKTLAARKS